MGRARGSPVLNTQMLDMGMHEEAAACIYSHYTELDVQRLPLERLASLTSVLVGTRRDGPIACRAIL